MASCGPSNPLQSVKDHLQRDTSLQRDQVAAATAAQPWAANGFRGAGAARQAGPDSASAQFESFNQFAPNLGPGGAHTVDPASQARGAVGYISERDALAQTGHQWAAEFQQQLPQQQSRQQSQQPQASGVQQGALMSFAGPQAGPQWSAAHTAAYSPMGLGVASAQQQAQPQRAAPAPPTDAVFEEVFAAFEKKLEAEQQASQLEKEEGTAQAEDLSAVASQIMNTLSASDTERSAQLAEKMKSSKFMALMDKLKSSEVKAGESDFVESDGAKVDPYMLKESNVNVTSQEAVRGPSAVDRQVRAAANADWAPQRRDMSTAPFGRGWGTAKYLVGLDDPDTYFMKLKASLEKNNPLAAEMPSAFEAARDLGPKPVHVGDWEERYEQW